MFEFFFKYPWQAFSRGDIVFAGGWSGWVLLALVACAAGGLGYLIWGKRGETPARVKPAVIWLLQTAMVAILLLLVWQPALSVATLRPQQNVVAVVVDDSKSMALKDGGASSRLEEARRALDSISPELAKRFQVRLYKAGGAVERVTSSAALKGDAPATRLGAALKQVASEAASLPIGAVLLMSDGADNGGGIDLDTTNEIRRYRIPVHTAGFGREKAERDVEIAAVEMPQRALAGAKLDAQVTVVSFGYENRPAKLSLKDETGKVLASRSVTLKGDGVRQTETLVFHSGLAGVRGVQATLEPLDGEENRVNNTVTRLVNVDGAKPRVLYIEGEPRWEFKFIRRAIDADEGLQLVSMLRTTQNKIYRQGISNPKELEQGFPATVDELFSYQAVIIGGIEAAAFTPTQMELLRQFVDRRGGGLLWLGARAGLADGGWGASAIADLLPVTLPNRKNTFVRDPAQPELTAAGRDTLLCRLDDDPARNVERWKKLPYMIGWQDAGTPKPGAAVLAEMQAQGRGKLPLLVTQNYGRGRTAVFATGGSWRWQMSQPLEDMSHEMFWQQMFRWLVAGSTGPVISRTPKTVYSDDPIVPLRAEVRDRNYIPVSDARVEARVMGPDGLAEVVELQPDPVTPGLYTANWGALKTGSYVVETVARRGDAEAGRDVLSFRREDGVSESFGTSQNRELLEKLSAATGGRYWTPSELSKLPSDITYSEAGISVRETRDLWDAPIFFIAALALRSAEWLLRRKWGVV